VSVCSQPLSAPSGNGKNHRRSSTFAFVVVIRPFQINVDAEHFSSEEILRQARKVPFVCVVPSWRCCHRGVCASQVCHTRMSPSISMPAS
jgi:hypothetical protein